MGKKFQVTNDEGYVIDCELDEDVTEDELGNHPDPGNAPTPEEIKAMEDEEEVHD